MNTIRHDFRSDTVTRPSDGMRAAMAEAEVGDDVYGDDPTVNLLEQRIAGMMDKEAAMFVPSGTMSNLLALLAHCERGDEYIAGQDAHCYAHEAGGAAVLGSIQPQPIAHQADGTMAIDDIENAIKPDDSHYARTRLIALENTFGGRALPMGYMDAVADVAERHGLGLHLDGARGFNAALALGIDIATLGKRFDTVSICLSKGLGAPVGSVLVGRGELIGKARRYRKMVGGGLRQSGILAAAALYALDHNVARLADDHKRAKRLAEGLARHPQLSVTTPDTNIVWAKAEREVSGALTEHLESMGIAFGGGYGEHRWVTHIDIGDDDIEIAIAAVDTFFKD
ncbi:low-specificity L-threonine aldolase [Devosia sp. MC1541]|uniref:low-specificity L-threonine aldolase n=1 Tax=Devosia sp. MC1541 TaxID=2725264 RepID=UPI00145DF894|nr:low-specificity L-threonine aldolase [Devosia sp. MC1541]